jgi:hypothetical protein
MATSGTYNFTLDVGDILEEAYERVGIELRTGYDYRTARRSLDLLMLEWQNRGLNLWTVKNASLPLVASQASYTLDADELDIVDGVIRTDEGVSDQTDLFIKRVSISNYNRQTNKLSEGRPTQYWVERTPTGITLHFWQVPNNGDYTFNYYYIERIEDSGSNASINMDVPVRFLPVLIAGLAYTVGLKTPSAAQALPLLQAEYERQWDLAADAHRNKASFFVKPGGYRI